MDQCTRHRWAVDVDLAISGSVDPGASIDAGAAHHLDGVEPRYALLADRADPSPCIDADGRGAVMVTVPEPATTLPYGCALLGILFHRRRSRRR